MSISSEISRISQNISDALSAVSAKGVTVPSGSNSDDLADLIAQISGGGGTTWETIFNQNVQIVSSSPNYVWVDNYTEPFSANEIYRVTWGSNTYTCQTIYDSNNTTYDGWYIGDMEAAGGQSTGNHEPFMIYRYKQATNVLVAATTTAAGTISLKIERQISGGGGGAIGGLSKYDSGTFTVASDYNYTGNVNANYTGSVLVTTTLADIKIIAIWDEAWSAQTATRGCFGAAVFVSGTLGVPGFASATSSPYYYGSGFGVNASTSNWFSTSSTCGPILHEMTTTVDAGKFGLKTNSSTYPLRSGDTIHWIAWGT